jgi:prophage maintenance system killer protein
LSQHLDIEHVIKIHSMVMSRNTRWPAALINVQGLADVLMRTRMSEQRDGADLIRQAAILAVGLAQARPFKDANPPTAFAALVAFLGINQASIFQQSRSDLARLLRLLSEEHDFENATSFFEARLRPVTITT